MSSLFPCVCSNYLVTLYTHTRVCIRMWRNSNVSMESWHRFEANYPREGKYFFLAGRKKKPEGETGRRSGTNKLFAYCDIGKSSLVSHDGTITKVNEFRKSVCLVKGLYFTAQTDRPCFIEYLAGKSIYGKLRRHREKERGWRINFLCTFIRSDDLLFLFFSNTKNIYLRVCV